MEEEGFLFLNAVVLNSQDEIKRMLKDKPVDRTYTIMHPLHHVEDVDMAKLLIDSGFDVNRPYKISTPLTHAILKRNLPLVKCFIDAGADIDYRTGTKSTPLHIATIQNHSEIVQCLVENSANINARADNNWTALHLAVAYDKLEIVKYLVLAGADYDILDNDGETAYDISFSHSEINTFFDEYEKCLESFRLWDSTSK